MKHQVFFSLKNNEKIFMNVVCCSRNWRFKGSLFKYSLVRTFARLPRHIVENHTMWLSSLSTEKQTTKCSSANFSKLLGPSHIILRIKRLEGKQCRSHDKAPHKDLSCLRIPVFSSLEPNELKMECYFRKTGRLVKQ